MAFIAGGVISIMVASFFACILGFIVGLIAYSADKKRNIETFNLAWVFTTGIATMIIMALALSSF